VASGSKTVVSDQWPVGIASDTTRRINWSLATDHWPLLYCPL